MNPPFLYIGRQVVSSRNDATGNSRHQIFLLFDNKKLLLPETSRSSQHHTKPHGSQKLKGVSTRFFHVHPKPVLFRTPGLARHSSIPIGQARIRVLPFSSSFNPMTHKYMVFRVTCYPQPWHPFLALSIPESGTIAGNGSLTNPRGLKKNPMNPRRKVARADSSPSFHMPPAFP